MKRNLVIAGVLSMLLLVGCNDEKKKFDFKIDKGDDNQKYIALLYKAIGYEDLVEAVGKNTNNKEVNELFYYCPYTQPSSISYMPFFSLYNPIDGVCQTFSTMPNDISVPDYSKMHNMLTIITKTIKTVGSLEEEPEKWCQEHNLEKEACLIGLNYKMLMGLGKNVRTPILPFRAN